MRDNVRQFVAIAARAFRLAGPVYEFGSYLVEGQGDRGDLRHLFPGSAYFGCDMRAGPGVDRVEDLAQLSLPDGVAKTIVCVDTLEHVFEIRRAIDEMLRVLAPGGVMLIAAPFDFYIHNHPDDYWRLTPSCLDRLLQPLAAIVVGSQGPETEPHTVYAVASKAPVEPSFAAGYEILASEMHQYLEAAHRSIPWPRRLKQRLRRWTQSRGERRRIEQYFTSRFAINMRLSSRAAPVSGPHSEAVPAGTRFDWM